MILKVIKNRGRANEETTFFDGIAKMHKMIMSAEQADNDNVWNKSTNVVYHPTDGTDKDSIVIRLILTNEDDSIKSVRYFSGLHFLYLCNNEGKTIEKLY